MDREQTTLILDLLLSGTLEENDGGTLLRTWAARGETGGELAATVRYLQKQAIRVPVKVPCFDLCGTGGSGLTRFNVSTTVAFVVAAAGIPVAKHGNRGSRKPNGSFDLLEALEIPFDLSPENEARLVEETGVCFIFARTHHPVVGRAVPYRKAAGGRSIFNLAGPLANPVHISRQIIGTIDESTAKVVAAALSELETDGALVVFGEPGIDEISVTGNTGYLLVDRQGIKSGTLSTPPHPGLAYASLPGGTAQENAPHFLALLRGEEQGPLYSMVCENAGAAIDLWRGEPPRLGGKGSEEARSLLASGAVRDVFEKHRALARKLSP